MDGNFFGRGGFDWNVLECFGMSWNMTDYGGIWE